MLKSLTELLNFTQLLTDSTLTCNTWHGCEHTQLQGLQDITAVQLYIHLNFGLQIDGLDKTRQLYLKPSTSWWVNHYKLMLCSQTLFKPTELYLKLW